MKWFKALGPDDEPEPQDGDNAPDESGLKWFPDPVDEEADLSLAYAGVSERSLLWVGRAVEGAADGTTDFIASTGNVDRMGDVIDQASWRLAAFRANPVIRYEHGPIVVGRAKRIGIADAGDGTKQLRMSVQWDVHESNPTGILMAHQHATGFRSAVSVGFLPGKTTNRADLPSDHALFVDTKDIPRWRAGYLYTQSELLEVSSVSVPANREALQLSMAAREHAKGGDFFAAAQVLIRGIAPKADADELLEAFVKSPRFRTAVLGTVLGTKAKTEPEPTGGNPATKPPALRWTKE